MSGSLTGTASGEVNNGWSVLHGPLDAEHSIGDEVSKLEDLSIGVAHMRFLKWAVEAAARWAKDAPDGDGSTMAEDKVFMSGFGHILVEIEAASGHAGPDGPDQGRRHRDRGCRAADRPDRPGGGPALRRGRHHRRRARSSTPTGRSR